MGDIKKLLQIEHGIIQAPMAGGAVTPQLAAAVSNYGGLGSLASGYVQPDDLRQQIRQVKQLTSCLFQVNVFVPEPIPDVKKRMWRFGRRDCLYGPKLIGCQAKKSCGMILNGKSTFFWKKTFRSFPLHSPVQMNKRFTT